MASIIIEIRITRVRAGEALFTKLKGIATIPPIKPIIVMILNRIKSVGKSGLKKCLIKANNFFKIHSISGIAHNLPSVKYSNLNNKV